MGSVPGEEGDDTVSISAESSERGSESDSSSSSVWDKATGSGLLGTSTLNDKKLVKSSFGGQIGGTRSREKSNWSSETRSGYSKSVGASEEPPKRCTGKWEKDC